MRIINLAGRVALERDQRHLDVEHASQGLFGSDPQAIFDRWDEFVEWSKHAPEKGWQPFDLSLLESPVPQPRQVFALGLNYRDHASEAGVLSEDLEDPIVFTKYVSSITGPYSDVVCPDGNVDWEAELVAVIARPTRNVEIENAWHHIAGMTGGQDFSERITQNQGVMPQFSLGKSFPGFSPMGPALATLDEFPDKEDIGLECLVNGVTAQNSRTSQMIESVAATVVRLSKVLTLYPGDLIFTGTPAGVGLAANPPRFLHASDIVTTRFEVIGELQTRMAAQK